MVGNIITSHVISQPMPLQIEIGGLLGNHAMIAMELHKYGVSCSYDEVMRFRRSAAAHASKKQMLPGFRDRAVDLWKLSSQNSQLRCHYRAILAVQWKGRLIQIVCVAFKQQPLGLQMKKWSSISHGKLKLSSTFVPGNQPYSLWLPTGLKCDNNSKIRLKYHQIGPGIWILCFSKAFYQIPAYQSTSGIIHATAEKQGWVLPQNYPWLIFPSSTWGQPIRSLFSHQFLQALKLHKPQTRISWS